jgi:rubrerythrin
MVKTHAAKKILYQIAAEFEDHARKLKEVIDAEEPVKATGRPELP